MGRIRQKLHSRRGASFLLALLFFLICALTASSVLMSAAASAGRSRGDRAEHQAYLTLSSAARLLCDEILDSTYRGGYHYYVAQVADGTDPETGETLYRDETHLDQESGQFTGALEGLLLTDLDALFARQFADNLADVVTHENTNGFAGTHTLTVTAGSGAAAVDVPIQVTLTVRETWDLRITAAYPADSPYAGYAIRAELSAVNPPKLPSGGTGYTSPATTWTLTGMAPESAGGEEARG